MTKAVNGVPALPTDSIADAPLPVVYQGAKTAIASCDKLDECKNWSDKALALRSYAKQAGDDAMYIMAVRIQARAIRRCGELLAAHDARPGNSRKQNVDGGTLLSRGDAASQAGLSKRQQVTASRVAHVADGQFNAMVEGGKPATITQIADAGKRTRELVPMNGRSVDDFKEATKGQGLLRHILRTAEDLDITSIARGCSDIEREAMIVDAVKAIDWLNELYTEIHP